MESYGIEQQTEIYLHIVDTRDINLKSIVTA